MVIYSSYCSWSSKRDITQYNSVRKNGISELSLPISLRNHLRQHWRKLGYVSFTSSFGAVSLVNTSKCCWPFVTCRAHNLYLLERLPSDIKSLPVSLMFVVSIHQINGTHLFCFNALFSAKMRLSMSNQTKWLNIEQTDWQNHFRGLLGFEAAFDLVGYRCLHSVFQSFFMYSLIQVNPLLFKENYDIGKYHIRSLINL